MLEMPEPWDTCRGKLLTRGGYSPRERSYVAANKAEWFYHAKYNLNHMGKYIYTMCNWSCRFSYILNDLVDGQISVHPSLAF